MNEEIQVGLGLNTAAFQEGLKSATREVSSFGSKIAAPITAVRAFGAALGGLVGLGTLKTMSDHAEQILNISEALNISAENFQRFNGALSYSGISAETSQKALTKFTMKLGDLDSEGSKAGKALANMGIDARDSNGDIKGTMTLLGEIADAFAAMPDKAERSRYAVELFGKQGLKMVSALSQGSKELSALGESTPIISQKSLETLDVAGDKLKGMGNWFKTIGTTALAKVTEIAMPDFSGIGYQRSVEAKRAAEESAKAFTERRAAELEKTVAGSKEHLAYEKALLASQMARETVGKQAWLTQKQIVELTGQIALLEQSTKPEDRLLAESKKTDQLKLQADFAKLSADHMAKQVALAERLEAIEIAEKEFRLVGAFQQQTMLRDKLSKMMVADAEYLKTEAKLKAVSVELAEKQVAAEKRKLEVTQERIQQLNKELALALSAKDNFKADELRKSIEEKILLLKQQQKDVAQKAGEEGVKLASLQASLAQKRAQLTETKADASKYTISELAELGGRGNAAQRKASFDAWRFQQANTRVDTLKAQGANPEEIAKAITDREDIRKNLDANFIKSTELKAPWADLEDAIRKLTEEMKTQRAVAEKLGEVAPEAMPKDEAPPLSVEQVFAKKREDRANQIRSDIAVANIDKEVLVKSGQQVKMDNIMADLFPNGMDFSDPDLEAKMEEIRQVMSGTLKVKLTNGP